VWWDPTSAQSTWWVGEPWIHGRRCGLLYDVCDVKVYVPNWSSRFGLLSGHCGSRQCRHAAMRESGAAFISVPIRGKCVYKLRVKRDAF